MVNGVGRCDWCGRPATIRDYKSGGDPSTEFEDPRLCDVCWLFILNVPSDAEAVLMEVAGYDEALKTFERALNEQFRSRSLG